MSALFLFGGPIVRQAASLKLFLGVLLISRRFG